jgi:hypothetical protein
MNQVQPTGINRSQVFSLREDRSYAVHLVFFLVKRPSLKLKSSASRGLQSLPAALAPPGLYFILKSFEHTNRKKFSSSDMTYKPFYKSDLHTGKYFTDRHFHPSLIFERNAGTCTAFLHAAQKQ